MGARRRPAQRAQKNSRSGRAGPPRFPDGLPRIFYWYDDHDPARYMGMVGKMQQSLDPRHRAMAESVAATVAHMQQGREQVVYEGDAHCRICGEKLGSRDLTNTFVCWPQGSEHYVTAHGVWTPQHSWLAGVVMGQVDPRTTPPPRSTSTWSDSGAWETRIPGFLESKKKATSPHEPVAEDQPVREPKTPGEKIGVKIARVLGKAWEAEQLDDLMGYMYSLMPVEMREELVGIVVGLADPAWLPQAPSASAPALGLRPMSEAEMWQMAAEETVKLSGDE